MGPALVSILWPVILQWQGVRVEAEIRALHWKPQIYWSVLVPSQDSSSVTYGTPPHLHLFLHYSRHPWRTHTDHMQATAIAVSTYQTKLHHANRLMDSVGYKFRKGTRSISFFLLCNICCPDASLGRLNSRGQLSNWRLEVSGGILLSHMTVDIGFHRRASPGTVGTHGTPFVMAAFGWTSYFAAQNFKGTCPKQIRKILCGLFLTQPQKSDSRWIRK